ncbi:3-deoxy-manno-octulosonate cytidylyltransferase [Crateriforma conspicua]|uniref:3-deoxy-manno-octulosonate cytidylyltransferase n=1 Tax=Crateriforma conspicua TaxID=2527996 RepID=UPI001189E5FE|nr:3-deoxy-manno-octulosonate cytidylyltransferase [Crateriforma conspicua]QDV65502.1 3-deoxy-manno-octulosonate cytidylyltransferase [Crateriforma conspicua]
MKIQIVIPARLASSRLPKKLLLRAGGKSVLQHTYDAAMRSQTAIHSDSSSPVIVAVDDDRLYDEVLSFGGHAVRTSVDCASGTDRVAEVATQQPQTDIFVNVQGDEPEIDPDAIDRVARALCDDADAEMATVVTPIRDRQRMQDPACVKAVFDDAMRAIYFSRAPIPFDRDGKFGTGHGDGPDAPVLGYQHLGLYAYRREFLGWFAGQACGVLESIERLEQLRAIQAGRRIAIGLVNAATPGIDTEEDFRLFADRVETAK